MLPYLASGVALYAFKLFFDGREGPLAKAREGGAPPFAAWWRQVLLPSLPMLIFYAAAAWLLPARPRDLYRDPDEELFWRSFRRSPRDTLGETRRKFRELERKLRRLEAYVTSRKFDLDREFRNMK